MVKDMRISMFQSFRTRAPSLAAASFMAALALVAPASAQQPAAPAPATAAIPSSSHLQAARDVVVTSGVTSAFGNIFNEFSANVKANLVTRPEMLKELDTVLAQLKPEADKRIEDMVNVSARIFANRMSEAELKEVQAFFNSPVGRRYNSIRPQMIDEMFTQLQPWTFRTSDFLFTYTRDEMKKRGHDIGG
jgi:uncharacterized protein